MRWVIAAQHSSFSCLWRVERARACGGVQGEAVKGCAQRTVVAERSKRERNRQVNQPISNGAKCPWYLSLGRDSASKDVLTRLEVPEST